MDTAELAQLKEVIHDTVNETTLIRETAIKAAFEAHEKGDDHRFVRSIREKEKRKTENMERLKGNMFFYLFVTLTGTIGTAVWQFVKRSAND